MQYATEISFKKTQVFKMDKTALLKKWGSNLRDIRIKSGYRNQGDLAEAMNKAGFEITQPGISRAENGQLDKPQEDIAEFFIKRHKKENGQPYSREEIFSVPVDWEQKYYKLLEEMQNKPSQERINQLEGLVSELQKQVQKLQDDKGNKN